MIQTEIETIIEKPIKEGYFPQSTEDAIIKYNNTDNAYIKNELYKTFIKKSFDKLAENLIYTGKYYKYEDSVSELKNDAIAYLIEQLHLYKREEGKAFSYFNMICRNYLINRSKTKYNQLVNQMDLDCIDYTRNVSCEESNNIALETIKSFIDAFSIHIDDNLYIYFKKKKDQNIAYAVITLLKNRLNLETFNKKALYLMIREMTDEKTANITKVVNILKLYYIYMYKQFDKSDKIDLMTKDQIKSLKRMA